MTAARKPSLQQRRVGREREKWQSDRRGKETQEPERLAHRGWPAKTRGDRERQRERRNDQQRELDDDRRAARQVARNEVRIAIAREQRRLEKYHGHRPHLRRTAEPRQHHFGEHRLDREQQRGTQKNRGDQRA